MNKEVVPAFDMLIEELERIIPDLNSQGKDLLQHKRYAQAYELINRAYARRYPKLVYFSDIED